MSRGRLTKQELGWLLTQEAKGAAQRLRVGVQNLKPKQEPPPASRPATLPGRTPPIEAGEGANLDATLDALDDAMRILSTLHGPAAGRGRRGRIDIAALLWEIAPDAHISIEPGSGTEVFGEESELRRMLQIVIGHETGAGSSVTIKRDGDDVRVSAVLGPDSSSTSDTERALLGRMAVRYGGRYELEGGAETLILPADGAAERSEAAQLRKELEEAKKQGEAYARELAQVIAHEDLTSGPGSVRATPGVERFGLMLRFARGIAGELRGILSPASRYATGKTGGETEEERWESVRRSLARGQEFVGSLAALGELDPAEPNGIVDLVQTTREVVRVAGGRAARAEVTVEVEAPKESPLSVRAAPHATVVLIRELVAHAIAASPKGSTINVRFETRNQNVSLHVDDAGATLPSAAHRSLVELEIEPGTYGRPSAVPLYIASEIASWQNVSIELGDAPAPDAAARTGLRVTATFRRA